MNIQLNLEQAKGLFFDLYPLHDIVMDKGEGCYLFDTEGNKYLDFAAGIAVAALGHAHPVFKKAVSDQIEKFTICPASYLTEPRINCAEFLVENSPFDKVFFCNSGTEAVEAALKLARKRAYEAKGTDCNEIIAFDKGFHGRTMGSASLTYKSKEQPFFAPYVGGISFAEFNNLESVKALVSDKTAAIILEPVQGEGGVTPASQAFMKGIRAICDEHNIALIFDEIQCGIGRCGTKFAFENYGVEPDIITLAKGLGGGFPIGATLAKEEFAKHIGHGTHGTTYGGNPLATNVSFAVLKEIFQPAFLGQVKENGQYFVNALKEIAAKSGIAAEIRGMGLMVGMDVTIDPKLFVKKLQKNGLLVTSAGKTTIRFTPPLIVSKHEIDEAITIIETTLKECEGEQGNE